MAELALKEYNDKGGYQSKKVEAVIYDDETKACKRRRERHPPHHPRQGLRHGRTGQFRRRARHYLKLTNETDQLVLAFLESCRGLHSLRSTS